MTGMTRSNAPLSLIQKASATAAPAPNALGKWPRTVGTDRPQMSAVSITTGVSARARRLVKVKAGEIATMLAAIAAGHAPTSRRPT